MPDTNVVVAASICGASEVLDTVVTEPHHEESRRLLDALLDAGNCCRCVVSPTVAGEVRRVARRAAARAVGRAIGVRHAKKSNVEFAEMRRVADQCVEQSSRFISLMTLYNPHPSLVEVRLAEVEKMVEEIKKRHVEILSGGTDNRVTGASNVSIGAGCSGAVRDMAGRDQNDLAQYERFLKREPAGNTMDKKILAEAAAIRDIVHDESERFCIASNDMGIFAPLGLRDGRVSRPIVDMISDRFAIMCGLPRAVRMLCTEA